MNNTDWDMIILGQGLAGSLLAWNLNQHGKRVLIIDQASEKSASRIAAGLVNPVTGKRFVKLPDAEAFLAAATSEYAQLKNTFNTPFFHPKKMTRLFQSEENLLTYSKRLSDPAYHDYLGEKFDARTDPFIKTPLGGFTQQQTGYLDIPKLLDTLRDYFIKKNSYMKDDIDYSQIKIHNQTVTINNQNTRQLIFCEGYKATSNPWFQWLPFKLAKGEILTLASKKTLPENIINFGNWLLPVNSHTCRFGATYQWHDLDEKPTDDARKTLLQNANSLFKSDMSFSLIEQQAGIRPCTNDTQPYIGKHPQHPYFGFFNGFGSKGSMLIPFYARQFCENILENKPLDKKSDLKRYWNPDAG
ncbi:MAG: FAD-dependent oxidoreductase [Gammaproteobacteria bacterium]|nr:FAD-dependent oxidoreductase [Gammaproteobacteria bacterium]